MNLKFSSFAACCAILGASVSNAQTPFSTAVRNFTYIGKPGMNADANPISLYTSLVSPPIALGPGTGVTFTNTPAQSLNGAGLNNLDGFMYAMDYLYAGPNSTNANLYRVGSDAVASQVGIIPGPTSADAGRAIQFSFVSTAGGVVDGAGNYWFSAYTLTDAFPPYTAGKVDVFFGKITGLAGLTPGAATLAPSYYKIDISDPALQTGYTNFVTSAVAFMSAGQPYTNANGGWQDMDIRPSDGKFYSYIAFPSAPTALPGSPTPEPPLNSYLARIDVVNSGGYWGKVTLVNTTPNTTPNLEADGAYFDATGNYFVMFTDGQTGQVDVNTGAVGTLSASGAALSGGEMRGDMATNTPIVPLPVKIISFRATPLSDAVLLNWKLEATADFASVNVERSGNAKDFTTINTVMAAENRTGYTDASPLADAYYRLKFNDKNGSFSYSNIVRVTINEENNPVVTVYPNPLKNSLSLQTSNPSVVVALMNAAGTVVTSGHYANTANGVINIDLPKTLAEGNYILTVRDGVTGSLLVSKTMTK